MRDASSHLPTLSWVLLCAALLLSPAERVERATGASPLVAVMEDAGHAVLGGVLAGLALRSAARSGGGRRAARIALAASALYLLALEAAQALVPGRAPAWGDAVLDLAGIALAAILLRPRPRPQPPL